MVVDVTESQSKETRRRQRADRAAKRAARRGEKPTKKKKGFLREWLDAMVFAIIFMLIVRTLLFDLFRIPTPSMEKSLLVGDYLFVSKLHYGTRTPITLGIPFTPIYVRDFELPWTRLPGFSSVKRGDAVVFNWPRDEEPLIDRKMHYIKRVVGLPGDTLEVIDKVVHINGEPQPLGDHMQQHWYVYKEDARTSLSPAMLEELGITERVTPTLNPSVVRVSTTKQAAEALSELPYVERVLPAVARPSPGYRNYMYPGGRDYTTDNYGPVLVPKEGLTVTLTEENWPVIERVISQYEGHTTRVNQGAGSFFIDGQPSTSYTFEQDYFFMMGDNRDNSEDSRFWGFVPYDHIVGKAILVYFSWDAPGSPPLIGQIRYSRLFSVIR